MDSDNVERKDVEPGDYLSSGSVEVDGQPYVYYFESATPHVDRCVGFSSGEGSDVVHLFQLTHAEKNSARSILNGIPLENQDVLEVIIREGVDIVEKSVQDPNNLSALRRDVVLGGVPVKLAYQSRYIDVLGTTLHDRYQKDVMERQGY